MLTAWEDMTVLEQMQCQYWDMYKDAYGFRPRGIDTSSWTEEDFKQEFEYLVKVIEENYVREQAEQKLAVAKFEDRIDNLMHSGTTRSRVVEWFMQAEDVYGDADYFEFLNNLPYGYLKQKGYV